MTYKESLTYIASLAPRGWRLGLDRMQALVERAGITDSLGQPEGPQYIHIAGTNGKGSVTAFVQSMLIESGYNTGAFFSPFVYDPRERVQLGREYITPQEMADITEWLKPIAESFTGTDFGGVTEFEFKAALAFEAYKRHKCEWVALEVGLGGRLDATNVVSSQSSAIVSIGLDHTSILGETHQLIAHEKAGVMRPGKITVVGEVNEESMREIQKCAEETSTTLWRVGREVQYTANTVSTPARTYKDLEPGLPGEIQHHNLAVAIACMDAANATKSEEGIQAGARRAVIPGRFQLKTWRGRRFLLDGAHNREAAKVLAQELKRMAPKRVILLTNMVQGHDPTHFYSELTELCTEAHVVPIDFHRAQPVAETAKAIESTGIKPHTYHSVHDGIHGAHANANEDDLIVVTGSFYLVGEVGRAMWPHCGTMPQVSRP
jgi:dihydrofolate synthase/folylpolyglutamate synthase